MLNNIRMFNSFFFYLIEEEEEEEEENSLSEGGLENWDLESGTRSGRSLVLMALVYME
jgi:hypothetical protein